MNAPRTGEGPGEDPSGSWATEGLPLSVRRQLLERDLKRALSRTAAAQGSATGQGPGMSAGEHAADGAADHDC